MDTTPKGNRLHIAIFGRTNVGKSSLLNYLIGQEIAITSTVAGTTTDVVEKAAELLPLGPVLFLDTAGLDDTSELGRLRLKKTKKIFDRTDHHQQDRLETPFLHISEKSAWPDRTGLSRMLHRSSRKECRRGGSEAPSHRNGAG
jgi:GTPase SAR1 family protein